MDDLFAKYNDRILILEAKNKLLRKKLGDDYHEFDYYYDNHKLDKIAEDNEIVKSLILKIEDLPFGTHTKNVLSRAKIKTLGDLVQYEFTDIVKFEGFGSKCISELKSILNEHNLSMGMDVEGIVLKALAEERSKRFAPK